MAVCMCGIQTGKKSREQILLPGATTPESTDNALSRDRHSSKVEVWSQVGRVHGASLSAMRGDVFVGAGYLLPDSELPGDP